MPGRQPPKVMMAAGGAVPNGRSSRWHHERAPHFSQIFNLPPSAPTQWVGHIPPILMQGVPEIPCKGSQAVQATVGASGHQQIPIPIPNGSNSRYSWEK